MRHTLGEWTVERLKNYQWRIQSAERIICKEPFRGTPPSEIIDEIEANARLIAAAPELLDALKDAEKALERVNAFVDYDYKWLEEKIDKALTKATGI